MLKLTIKDNVEILLREDERCRNEDLYLILKYWQRFDNLEVDPNIFQRLTNTESIRRSRTIIQNDDGLYLPSDPVIRAYRERMK